MDTLENLKILKNRKLFYIYDGKRLIYKIHNTVNGKNYIGATFRIKKRILEHIRYAKAERHKLACYIHFSIRKYGFKNFTFEVVESNIKNDEELEEREKYWIDRYNSFDSKFGYNLTYGGGRGVPNQKTILKKRESSHKIKVAKYDLNGVFVEQYPSVKDAARKNSIQDTDIHRCHKKNWTRNGFMYKKFKTDPLLKIEAYSSKKGKNLTNGDGFQGKNKLKCQLLNKASGLIEFEGGSLGELASKAGMHTTSLHRIYKNKDHKKWKLIKIR